MFHSLKRFARASKGLEALQVVLLIAIACVILAGVQGTGKKAEGQMSDKVSGIMGG